MVKWRRKRIFRKIYIKIDLKKAYDNVNRKLLIGMLVKRAQSDLDQQAINLIASMYAEQKIVVGDDEDFTFNPTKGP